SKVKHIKKEQSIALFFFYGADERTCSACIQQLRLHNTGIHFTLHNFPFASLSRRPLKSQIHLAFS
ncbi:MAG: hypothetical protein RSC44_02445, partial [Clostridia bacterium]